MIDVTGSEMHIGGMAIGEITEAFPEPLYVYDIDSLVERCDAVRRALPAGVGVFYSMKANPNPSIVAACYGKQDGVEISSGGEMRTALGAGCSPDRLIFVGPSKSVDEIDDAIACGVGWLVAESEEELRLIDEIAVRRGQQLRVAIRINPAFEIAGSRLKMGGVGRQFGMDEEQMDEVLATARRLRNVTVRGIHAYVGTRILDATVAIKAVESVLTMASALSARYQLRLDLVDVGGGLGVPYFPNESTFDLEQFGQGVGPVFEQYQRTLPCTRFMMELGRYLVAECGVYVTRVRYVKRSRGQLFALVSGGMNHCQASSAIGGIVRHHFPLRVLNRLQDPATERVTVCGPLCTPMDVLGRDVPLPMPQRGDLIGVLKTGAYGVSASPTGFLSHPLPTEVVVANGRAMLAQLPLSEKVDGQQRGGDDDTALEHRSVEARQRTDYPDGARAAASR